jgi:hypothetical protein
MEHLLQSGSSSADKAEQILLNATSHPHLLEAAGFEKFAYSDFYEEFMALLESVIGGQLAKYMSDHGIEALSGMSL